MNILNTVPLRTLYEDWAEHRLSDGTVLRFRGQVTAIVEEGPNLYQMRVRPTIQTLAPKRGKPSPRTKRLGPTLGISVGHAVSLYEQEGRGVLRITTELVAVWRTDGVDSDGEPIFDVEFRHHMEALTTPQPERPRIN